MNFSKSKVLLKKINALHDSAESFGNKFSPLERDLMLQYLRDLYECVSDIEDEPVNRAQSRAATSEKAGTANVHVPSPQVPQPEVYQQVQSAPVATSAHLTSGTNGSVGVGLQEEVLPTSEVSAPPAPKVDPELLALFDEQSTIDLSQRFANTAISDISRAMGINERILTINELFKGDQQAFQEAVQHLNALTSFEAAKQYLISGVASQHNWAGNKKKSKAAVFLKLVRRRYV